MTPAGRNARASLTVPRAVRRRASCPIYGAGVYHSNTTVLEHRQPAGLARSDFAEQLDPILRNKKMFLEKQKNVLPQSLRDSFHYGKNDTDHFHQVEPVNECHDLGHDVVDDM